MNRPFSVPAQLSAIGTMKDGGLRLTFHTNEMKKEEMAEVLNHHNAFGWLLFSENAVQSADVPTSDAPEQGVKSPSARLRAVLYCLYQHLGPGIEFDLWYMKQMNRLIEHFKAQLPER